jgi:hypothetical protein
MNGGCGYRVCLWPAVDGCGHRAHRRGGAGVSWLHVVIIGVAVWSRATPRAISRRLTFSLPVDGKAWKKRARSGCSDDACADPLTQNVVGDTDRADVVHCGVGLKLIVGDYSSRTIGRMRTPSGSL